MDLKIIIGLAILAAVLVSAGALVYLYLNGRRQDNLKSLLKVSRAGGGFAGAEMRERLKNDVSGQEYDRVKKDQRKALHKSQADGVSKEERYFHAGIVTKADVAKFEKNRYIIAGVLCPALALLGADVMDILGVLIGLLSGAMAAILLPSFVLDRRKKARAEEFMYYLPLVIEQVSIGVSSSLDIGPCLQRVVAMADERDSHNAVTELIRLAQYHVKSGVSLEEALSEIGARSGHSELKHAFLALASVAKHGGEISRQLQELADAVESQRETQIEARVKRLELEATGPVAIVFMGFLVLILVSFGLQIGKVFSS